MDQTDLLLLFLLVFSIILLLISSVVHNTFNLLSSVRLGNMASAGEKKAQKIGRASCRERV